MTRRYTRLLICLLMAALPLQGFAAVLKSFCGPAHHQVMQVAKVAAPHRHVVAAAGHHGHQHGHPDGHQRAVVQADHTVQPVDLAAAASENGKSASAKSAYCSACAAGCVGAVAPPTALLAPSDLREPSRLILPASPVLSGVVPAGLERPPKILA